MHEAWEVRQVRRHQFSPSSRSRPPEPKAVAGLSGTADRSETRCAKAQQLYSSATASAAATPTVVMRNIINGRRGHPASSGAVHAAGLHLRSLRTGVCPGGSEFGLLCPGRK
eukprot:CAMPEP_0202074958 /NCGR_PEP_ID=MMETSP0964-20121228/3925_1 /ASSEMBLY_ACC=CAM_ASM_000500 /TAXON_ID=4773 /ORGANISM="Schizochytrium aggregatum, Strain ATCC28209" /LENGTH=111 /DNA_ID=CAMNT_0048642129 /DNA_START=443 /DNA_END=775 /DNA_ORIENTATION=-